ncbi:hypothetical protein [Gordonia hankookensis]|uniref:hypothetical protein n=1 Tax=Gordonia hankookensis TaxID=589403 RepID=UPI001CC11D5E|nr:hypothetical protein [Gordonia hankookensis]
MRVQAHLEVEAPKAGDPVLNLTARQWAGQARGPADNRAAGITRWLKGVADEYGDLAAALNAGAPDIRGAMTALANRTTLADADGYILDRGSRSYTVSFQPGRAPDGAEFDTGTAHEHQTALHDLGIAADTAVTNSRDAINAALAEIGGSRPPRSRPTAERSTRRWPPVTARQSAMARPLRSNAADLLER